MDSQTIYRGGIQVDGAEYTHFVRGDDGEYAEQQVPGLDELVTRRSKLTFELDYPFERPYAGTVIGDAGISLRQIVDAVRLGFRRMYRGATEEDIPNLVNKQVQGEYGEAFHTIDDLVIERITLDEEQGVLTIDIGS